MSATLSPLLNGRSDAVASTSSSTIAFASASFSRRRPGSPWMPTPISISSSPSSNSGEPFAGGVHDVSAMPMVRVTELTRSPSAIRSLSSAPFSEAAPIALMTKKLPATPRRPTVHVESFTATSSSTITVPIVMPSASAISAPISNAIRSPV